MAVVTHGMSYTRFYKIWESLKERCCNKNNYQYHRYGGRGIKVCRRWKHSFENFRDDMLSSYNDDLTIERIDNNKNYSPKNCRWATRQEQVRNQSSNIKYKGKCMKEWSEMTGINYDTLWKRIRKGMSWEEALNKPVDSRYCPTKNKKLRGVV